MKLELIRSQLAACEQACQEGLAQQAIEDACMTARLLMMQAAEWQAGSHAQDYKKTYIALVGVAGAVQSQLEALIAKEQDVTALAENLRSRLAQIKTDFAGTEAEYQQIMTLNNQILAEEEALRKKKKELEDLLKKIQELTDIKEKQLQKLREDLEEQKQKLADLEQEYTACEALYKTVEAELNENLSLMVALPESTGTDTLDALVEQAKQHQIQLQTAQEDSAKPLRKIIEEVQRLQKLAEGTQ